MFFSVFFFESFPVLFVWRVFQGFPVFFFWSVFQCFFCRVFECFSSVFFVEFSTVFQCSFFQGFRGFCSVFFFAGFSRVFKGFFLERFPGFSSVFFWERLRGFSSVFFLLSSLKKTFFQFAVGGIPAAAWCLPWKDSASSGIQSPRASSRSKPGTDTCRTSRNAASTVAASPSLSLRGTICSAGNFA